MACFCPILAGSFFASPFLTPGSAVYQATFFRTTSTSFSTGSINRIMFFSTRLQYSKLGFLQCHVDSNDIKQNSFPFAVGCSRMSHSLRGSYMVRFFLWYSLRMRLSRISHCDTEKRRRCQQIWQYAFFFGRATRIIIFRWLSFCRLVGEGFHLHGRVQNFGSGTKFWDEPINTRSNWVNRN